MSVLLLRLAGPMQSWGTRSRFSHRDTGLEPSKSGVIGLLCAALGWPRESETFALAGKSVRLDEFAGLLSMAVRVDREGRFMRDYHTAQEVVRASGKSAQDTVLSERFYLADADFLVGLAGDGPLLESLAGALRQPRWVLFLGRKSFVPALPVLEGIAEGELLDILKTRPWRKRHTADEPAGEGPRDARRFKPLRYVIEVPFGTGEPRPDVPVSFVSRNRRFAVRHVLTQFHPVAEDHLLEPDPEAPCVPEQTGSEPPRPTNAD